MASTHASGTIVSTATAVPRFRVDRDGVEDFLRHAFALDDTALAAMPAVVESSQVNHRYTSHSVDYVIETRPLDPIRADMFLLRRDEAA